MKTIGQQIKWDFETNGDLEIKDKNGKEIYYENSGGVWIKREYDSQDNVIYCEYSDGVWERHERDSRGNQIYYENSKGFWIKREYDSKGNQIYFENSLGIIWDKRPKPCEDKVIEIDGKKYKFVKV